MHNDYHSYYYCIGKYKGYFGSMDLKGKIIVTFEFENLSFGALYQEFIFTKNDKMGVVSASSGEMVIDGFYNDVVFEIQMKKLLVLRRNASEMSSNSKENQLFKRLGSSFWILSEFNGFGIFSACKHGSNSDRTIFKCAFR